MTPSIVRRATATDVPAAAALAGELVRLHHETDPGRFFLPSNVERGYEGWFQRELGRDSAVVLVAEQGAELVGYAYGALEGRDWNALLDRHGAIHDVFVRADARRSGVGRRLIEGMIDALETLGAASIVLSTMVRNIAAQQLFVSCGFRPTMLEMTRGPGTPTQG